MFKFCFKVPALEPVVVALKTETAKDLKLKLDSESAAFKQKLEAETIKFAAEVDRLKQRLEIVESCSKAEIMHLKLTYQEDMNEKNSEIKALKVKLRHLLNKTEIR